MTTTTATKPRARQLRHAAKQSLKSRYWLTLLACLIAVVLGASLFSAMPTLNYQTDMGEIDSSVLVDLQQNPTWEGVSEVYESLLDWVASVPTFVWGVLSVILGFSLILGLAYACVGFCIRLGLCRFLLTSTDGEKPAISMLFSYFGRAFWKSVGMNVLRRLIAFLAYIPATIAFYLGFAALAMGIVDVWGVPTMTDEVAMRLIASVGQMLLLWLIALLLSLLTYPIIYRYEMADFVLAENPEVGAVGALRESALMMKGNKWRLFCLRWSFFGWHLLCLLTGSLGYLFLAPYIEQTHAEFYHVVSGRAAIREAVEDIPVLEPIEIDEQSTQSSDPS